MKKLLILAAFAALAVPTLARTANFYVSPSGNDRAKGSEKHPWRSAELAISKTVEYLNAHPQDSAALVFRGGEYLISDSILIKKLKSPLLLTASEGETPVLKGDRTVSGWTPVTDPALISRLPQNARGKVLEADLGEIEDLLAASEERTDLYLNHKRQTLSRWPNEGFYEGCMAAGVDDMPPTWMHVHGTHEGILKYDDARIDLWAQEKDAKAFGYWYWDWCSVYHAIDKVDVEKKFIYLDQPWHKYGYRDHCRFYAFNLFCEIDSPGEYYIDHEARKIYWFAPEGFDASRDITSLSVFAADAMIRISKCENLEMRGLTLEGGRKDAIKVTGGQNVTINGCHIRTFGRDAIVLSRGTGHKVQRCEIEEMGCGGVNAEGGDRKTLTPSGFAVSDCCIHDYALFARTYAPAVRFDGAGMHITHNHIYNCSSSALGIYGNDILIDYNLIEDVVQESDDQGGLDCYFHYEYRRIVLKHNWWRNIRGGNVVGAAAIRFDDFISGHVVYGNIFENCGSRTFGAVQINGGKDNWICGNLFYNCPAAVSGSLCPEQKWKDYFVNQNDNLQNMGIYRSLYRTRYPELNESPFEHQGRNFVIDNLLVGVKTPYVYEARDYVQKNDTELPLESGDLEYFLQKKVLQKYGLEPIPWKKIGIRK